ncbi:hypothetical protein N7448_008897 [Penicillium atrosanguineum]|uniref:Rhodopsin domain-containing protein n=1 Tax=Penicillium atrosanguineum TaxID=1132637 RepID=A0A9W9QC77_9EURO|nr:hypothetical protein N7448_008897 [Penicillium atrosanguineum]KAJ5330294.1 hypothetical protein N7476_000077 [Penicillium atrosanguineum]
MILRLYARFFIVKNIGFDDALAIVTMSVRETEVLDFVAHVLYTTALFLCRLSGLAFYYRLTARTGKLHIAILVATLFLFIAYLLQLFLLIFHCRPVTVLWPYGWQSEPTTYKCLSLGLVYSVNSGVSLACDVIMFIIPSILIKQLHVSREKKIKLAMRHHDFCRPRLARGGRPMGRRWQLGLQSNAVYLECRDRRHNDCPLGTGTQTPLRKSFSHLTDRTFSGTLSWSTANPRSQSKPARGLGSNVRDSKRFLHLSKRDHDDYEMMPSVVSVTRDANGPIVSSKAHGTVSM